MRPNRHKLALLTWGVVYPMITGLLLVLEPLVGGLAMPLRTLVLTAIMVPAMVYLAMPFATTRLDTWLASHRPGGSGQPPVNTEIPAVGATIQLRAGKGQALRRSVLVNGADRRR